jgi:hypothetical protein
VAKFRITAPNGQKFEITAPEGATAEQAYAAFQKAQGESVAAAEPQPGTREYADMARDRAMAGEALPMVSEAPPEWQQPPRDATLMDMAGRLGETASDTFTGAMQGLTMGSYDELASAVGTPINAAARLMGGEDSINGMGDVLPFLGRSFQDTRQGQQGLVDQAYQRSPAAAISGDIAGSLGLGLLSGGANVTSIARPTIAGMAGRGAIEGGLTGSAGGFNAAPEDTLESRLTSAGVGGATGAALGAVTGGILGGRMAGAQAKAVPTTDELFADARTIYQGGKAAGSAPPTLSNDIADAMESVARSKNVILPNGELNPTYTALNGVLKVSDAYKGRPLSMEELQRIRENIRDVVANPEPGVQRIGMDMLDEFNKFAYKAFPELEEADDIYWKAKTGELIEKMGRLAQARSGQYSQSGMENALRAEFRAIERQIIKGKVKGLPPELVDQISKVAQGDELQDFARWVSKFGIQNPLTSSTGILAGLASGSALPTLGIWAGAQGAGALARGMANEKYKIASALARSGGQLPAQDFTPVAQALIQGGASLGGRGAASLTDGL